MSVRATNPLPSRLYQSIKSSCSAVKAQSDAAVAFTAVNVTDYDYLINIHDGLKGQKTSLDGWKQTPGIVEYAKEQEDDPNYNLQAELTFTLAEMDNVIVWLEANLPIDVTLVPLADRVPGSSNVASPTYTPAQTASLRTQLQQISDSIS